MTNESSFLAHEKCELITKRLLPFAIGWLGAMGIWLLVFAAEGRLTSRAVIVVGVQAAICCAAIAFCRAAPAAPRVVPVVVAVSVLLGLASTMLVQAVGAYGEILAFMLLTLYLAAALLFSWGWRAELALLLATLIPWMLVLERFVFFVPFGELAAAVAIGSSLALAIAEGSARNVRSVLRRRRAQEETTRELQLSRDAYRDIAEHARDMIWSADPSGCLTYVNEALMGFLGLPEAEILGRAAGEFWTTNPANPDFAMVIARARTGEVLPPLAIECTTPRGPRWVEVVSSVVYDPHGTVGGFRGISRDIQERRDAEAALRQSEERFRSAFDHAAIGKLVVGMDGKPVEINRAFCEMLGYDTSELLERSMDTLAHPTDVAQATLETMRLLQGDVRAFQMEKRYFHKDGHVVWCLLSVSLARDASGQPRHLIAQVQDISERKAAEDALRASEARYRGLLESQHESVIRMDLEGRVTFANDAYTTTFGEAREALLGRTFFHLIHPDDHQLVRDAMRALEHPPHRVMIESRNFTPQGMRWFSWEGGAVLDDGGHPIELQAVGRDVTERHAAEEALRASEARYRGLVESQQELIVRLDAVGRFTFVNDAYATKFGRPQPELLGQSFLDLVHPDDRSGIAEAMMAMARPPHRVLVEIRNLTVEGVRWIAWEGGVVTDAAGRMVEAQAVGRDVTERRASEDALRASEARYRGLVESARELVTRFDRDGNLTFANDSYCQAIGYARESIVGRNPMFLVHPDDQAAVIASVRAAMQPPYRARRESRGLTPTGWRWFDWELSGVRDDDDRVVEIQQVGRDMTARRQAEADLRESEERFRSAFDDAAIGMGVTTPTGRTMRVNPALCDMLGYAEHELLGRTQEEIVHPDDRKFLEADRKRLVEGHARSYRVERRYVRSDGRFLWVHATASVVRDPNGEALYLIGQLQDVTERRLAEEALRGSLQELRRSEEKLRLLAQRQVTIREEERKRLGFDLHDDVCQELVGVGILVESLRRKLAPMPLDQAAEFDRVVGYLGEVVEHLRLLARELRPLLLRDLGLDGSLRSLADGMSSATLRVVTSFQTPIPRLDEEAEVTVYRIAQEALANAVRHAAAGRVVVALAVVDGMLRLEVRDDGRGFDPETRPAVALGLASMEERALALGGRFQIQSAPGQGTTVLLVCPLEVRGADSFREPGAPFPTRSSSPPSTATTPRSVARD